MSLRLEDKPKAAAADESQVAAVFDELARFDRRADPNHRLDRTVLALAGILLAVKLVLVLVHATQPIPQGKVFVFYLGFGIILMTVLPRLPMFITMFFEMMRPRNPARRSFGGSDWHLQLVEELSRHDRASLEKARDIVRAELRMVGDRLRVLVGSLDQLGLVPAIAILLTAFATMGSEEEKFEVIDYGMIAAITLYYFVMIAQSITTRYAIHLAALDEALERLREK